MFIFILMLSSVNAFSKDKGLDWLKNNINYQESSIEEASYSLSSLKSNNLIDKNYLGYTILQQRVDSCLSDQSCNPKDVALLALTNSNFNVDNSRLFTFLDNSIGSANVEDWYIQIQTTSSGKCTIIYDQDKSKVVIVDGNKKLKIENEPGEYNWINVKSVLGLNFDKPIEDVTVDCTKPSESKINDAGMLISLLRISNNEFYIYDEKLGRIADLKINNACYLNKGQCSKEDSLYTAWALKKLGKDIIVLPYLEKNVVNDKDYAMLFSMTNDQRYSQLLIDSQHPLGHWNNQDILTTSFAINSLKSSSQYKDQSDKAIEWLKSKQIVESENNGSFGSPLSTSSAIYLVFTQNNLISPNYICGNNITELNEECDDGNILNGDGCSSLCKKEFKCNEDSDCPDPVNQKCSFNGKCESRIICNQNGKCDSGETQDNCPQDCKGSSIECTQDKDCRDASKPICNLQNNKCEAESISGCTKDSECSSNEICKDGKCDTKPKSKALLWVSLIILIGIFVGGYFTYNKFFKKPKIIQPSYLNQRINKPMQNKTQTSRPSYKKTKVDDNLEVELDKSIKEAERLLKK